MYSWQNYGKWGSGTEQTPRSPRLLAVILVVLTNSCIFWLLALLYNTIKCMCKFYSNENDPASSYNNFLPEYSTFITLVMKTVYDLYFIASNNLLHTCNVIDVL